MLLVSLCIGLQPRSIRHWRLMLNTQLARLGGWSAWVAPICFLTLGLIFSIHGLLKISRDRVAGAARCWQA